MNMQWTPAAGSLLAQEVKGPTRALRALLPVVYAGGGDSRAFERFSANVPPLISLGIVNVMVSGTNAVVLGCAVNGFFGFEGAAAAAGWFGGTCFGAATLFANQTLFQAQFQAQGARLLTTMRPQHSPLPNILNSTTSAWVLRLVLAGFFSASVALPAKMNLTKADQTVEISNETSQKNSRQARTAREAVDTKIRQTVEAQRSAQDQVAALAFQQSVIEVGQLGGDVPASPPDRRASIPAEVLALARNNAALHQRKSQIERDRNDEIAMARQHDRDARALRRQRGRHELARVAEQRRTGAQNRANQLAQQLPSLEAQISKVSAELDAYHRTVAVQLEQAQRAARDGEQRVRDLETSRERDIAQRTQTGDGYRQISDGIIGRVESLQRMVVKSEAAWWTLVAIALLLAAWDLLPLLIKVAIKVPAYALRIAAENRQAFVKEAKAQVAADLELLKLLNQVKAEVSAFRSDERQRALEWYRGFPPVWLARLQGWIGWLRPNIIR